MAAPSANRLQTFIGLVLLIIAVLGFILSLVLGLPRAEEVQTRANALEVIPREFFSTDPVTQEVRKLNVPNGVPVTLDAGNIGRSNVFEGF